MNTGIHPTLQFEAKYALHFLDNLLHSSMALEGMAQDCFSAVPIFATGRDLKKDFMTLSGNIGTYEFKWTNDLLEGWSNRTCRRVSFEANFDDKPCNSLFDIWDCSLEEAQACVRAAVSHLAQDVSSFVPSMEGGVAGRFKTLVKDYRLTAREANLLLLGLCVSHDFLEYGLSARRCRCNRNFLVTVEEAATYIGCAVDDIMPLVRNDAKLIASGLLDDDLTVSFEILKYLEGRNVGPNIKAYNTSPADDDIEELDALFNMEGF